jgi:hypothetical protein
MMSQLSFPLSRMMRKNPFSPHHVFQEFATSQYGVLVELSTPQPIILMAWPPSSVPVVCL